MHTQPEGKQNRNIISICTLLKTCNFIVFLSVQAVFLQRLWVGSFQIRTTGRFTVKSGLVQVAVRKKIRVNDNMSIRVQRSPRLGKGTNDYLFPLASFLNINELGHMLCPRPRSNRAIILSRGTEPLSSVS